MILMYQHKPTHGPAVKRPGSSTDVREHSPPKTGLEQADEGIGAEKTSAEAAFIISLPQRPRIKRAFEPSCLWHAVGASLLLRCFYRSKHRNPFITYMPGDAVQRLYTRSVLQHTPCSSDM